MLICHLYSNKRHVSIRGRFCHFHEIHVLLILTVNNQPMELLSLYLSLVLYFF